MGHAHLADLAAVKDGAAAEAEGNPAEKEKDTRKGPHARRRAFRARDPLTTNPGLRAFRPASQRRPFRTGATCAGFCHSGSEDV